MIVSTEMLVPRSESDTMMNQRPLNGRYILRDYLMMDKVEKLLLIGNPMILRIITPSIQIQTVSKCKKES